jgi:protein translocase SecG subunit
MLYRLLLIILILDSLVLIAAILLQAGKGSGLAANFGGASSSPDAFIGCDRQERFSPRQPGGAREFFFSSHSCCR